MFYIAYRTLLVMFCILKFYFVDLNGMLTFSNMASENACALQSWENIIFQNKTLLVMLYRHNKTVWYQFCNFTHFLKAENSQDSLASSCEELWIGFHVTQNETGLLLELVHYQDSWVYGCTICTNGCADCYFHPR